MTADPFDIQRAEMVTQQIEQRGIHDPRLLSVIRAVPRHRFVPEALRGKAYDDHPLPIGDNQTISQPYIVAMMSSLLQFQGDETVLEIGTGSGYQAAVLSSLASAVHTIEINPQLAEHAAAVLADLGYLNVFVHCADGTLGWPAAAPYHGILVTAAAPMVPPPLLDQLAEGGRLIIPIGGQKGQFLRIWQRHGDQFLHEDILPVFFVPLRGEYGWAEDW